MSIAAFGYYNRKQRESVELPLREVVAYLGTDASTHRKVGRGEQTSPSACLKPLPGISQLNLTSLQKNYIADTLIKNHGDPAHLTGRLKGAEKHLKNERNNVE